MSMILCESWVINALGMWCAIKFCDWMLFWCKFLMTLLCFVYVCVYAMNNLCRVYADVCICVIFSFPLCTSHYNKNTSTYFCPLFIHLILMHFLFFFYYSIHFILRQRFRILYWLYNWVQMLPCFLQICETGATYFMKIVTYIVIKS